MSVKVLIYIFEHICNCRLKHIFTSLQFTGNIIYYTLVFDINLYISRFYTQNKYLIKCDAKYVMDSNTQQYIKLAIISSTDSRIAGTHSTGAIYLYYGFCFWSVYIFSAMDFKGALLYYSITVSKTLVLSTNWTAM